MDAFVVRASVPIVSFRPHLSRDYQDTYPVPPPATVFGMLLSLCGVTDGAHSDYRGTGIAIMVDRVRESSRVLRKLRRDPVGGRHHGIASYRPDYQEVILGLEAWIAVRQGDAVHDLSSSVRDALEHPEGVDRYGALSLGESTFLVDEIAVCRTAPPLGVSLHPHEAGSLTLPVWVDCEDPSATRLRRFSLVERAFNEEDYVRLTPGG